MTGMPCGSIADRVATGPVDNRSDMVVQGPDSIGHQAPTAGGVAEVLRWCHCLVPLLVQTGVATGAAWVGGIGGSGPDCTADQVWHINRWLLGCGWNGVKRAGGWLMVVGHWPKCAQIFFLRQSEPLGCGYQRAIPCDRPGVWRMGKGGRGRRGSDSWVWLPKCGWSLHM